MLAKQIELRDNIKKYFDMAYEGEPIIVPRVHNKNVVIISEAEYNRLNQAARVASYAQSIAGKLPPSVDNTASVGNNVKKDNIDKLLAIQSLQQGWNGNDAPALSDSLINKVRSIIDKLSIQPEIFPTALGTIQLEYDNSRRDHMEIEIGESDIAEIFISHYSGHETFENAPATAKSINKRVGEFYK